MWSNSKSSSLSFRSAIRGGSTSELPFKNLIMWLVSLLPVTDLASSPGFGCDLRGSESVRFWGAGFGFGSVCLGPGSGSVRFLQARFGFGSDLSAQCGFGSESDRFGIGSDSALKTGAMPMRNADAMAVEIHVQLFTNRCLMGL